MNVERYMPIGCLVLVLSAQAAHADSLGSPAAARNYCQTTKHAGTPEALEACCNDAILEDPPAKQKRLVKECVTGTAQQKSPEEIAYAEKQKADLDAERQRRAAREAAGGKVGRKQAAPTTPSPVSTQPPASSQSPPTGSTAPTPAAPSESQVADGANPAQAINKAQSDCQKNATRTALSSLGSIARRMGAKVPSTNCP